MLCSLPRRVGSVCFGYSCAFPRAGIPEPLWPSRNERPVGTHILSFEACSSFTLVTACGFAHPPFVGLVGRLRRQPLPASAASQLPRHSDNSWDGTLTRWWFCAVRAHVRFSFSRSLVPWVESRNGASALIGLVSAPRSSNRTCRFPASGSPTDFTRKHTQSFQPL